MRSLVCSALLIAQFYPLKRKVQYYAPFSYFESTNEEKVYSWKANIGVDGKAIRPYRRPTGAYTVFDYNQSL